jgi:hypothetical protein
MLCNADSRSEASTSWGFHFYSQATSELPPNKHQSFALCRKQVAWSTVTLIIFRHLIFVLPRFCLRI